MTLKQSMQSKTRAAEVEALLRRAHSGLSKLLRHFNMERQQREQQELDAHLQGSDDTGSLYGADYVPSMREHQLQLDFSPSPVHSPSPHTHSASSGGSSPGPDDPLTATVDSRASEVSRVSRISRFGARSLFGAGAAAAGRERGPERVRHRQLTLCCAEAAFCLAVLYVQLGKRCAAHFYFSHAHQGLASVLGEDHEHTIDALQWGAQVQTCRCCCFSLTTEASAAGFENECSLSIIDTNGRRRNRGRY